MRGLTVRMYRIGFGDCFLISLGGPDGPRHILVDCGVHPAGDIKAMKEVVADISTETGGRLDLVIASHAHKDHISGFHTEDKIFRTMRVGEVWLPWTEDPGDPVARSYRTRQLAFTRALSAQYPEAADSPAGFALMNLTGNERAMNLLHGGIAGGKVRYLGDGEPVIENAAGIPGLRVTVLGPTRDEAFLKRQEPPMGDRFLRAVGAGDLGAPIEIFPRWRVEAEKMPDHLRALLAQDLPRLSSLVEELDALAFQLERAMNNTSLVLLLSYGGEHLLLPGDAQYGSWEAWMRRPDAADLLGKVTLYKVSHHGSHNATPKSAWELMTHPQLMLLMSTQNKPWESIPYAKFIQAVANRGCPLVRSDSLARPGAPDGPPMSDLPPGLTRGPLWYEYTTLRN